MWSLPSLESVHSDIIEAHIESGGFWSILLFQRADNHISEALEKNWDIFSNAIGRHAHIITLLEVNEKGNRIKLKFPDNYETSVGTFCNELKIRLDHLPALVALNITDPKTKKPIYWSLSRRNPIDSDRALRQLFSDIQQSTENASLDGVREVWLEAVSKQLTLFQLGNTFKTIDLKKLPSVIRSVKKLLSSVCGF